MKFRDAYSEEIIDSQGTLFEIVADKNVDFEKFITDYMNSKVREQIDKRNPIICNYLPLELLEEFENTGGKLNKGKGFNFMLANWAGELYACLQDYLGISSREIIKRFSADFILNRCGGLHDYDMEIVIQKLVNLKRGN